jgi:hypothetical protein
LACKPWIGVQEALLGAPQDRVASGRRLALHSMTPQASLPAIQLRIEVALL